MEDFVKVITKKPITRGLVWPPVVIGAVCVLILILTLIYFYKTNNVSKTINSFKVIALVGFPLFFVSMIICSIFFPVETGKYKYTGELDPNTTIVQFEEFHQQNENVRFEDGVWKWEGN